MKCLLITDKRNWAYHSIAQSIIKYNPYSDVKLKILHSKGGEQSIKRIYKKFDRVLVMGWQTYKRVSFLPKKMTMVGLHSHHSWDKRKTTPEKNVDPPRYFVDFLSSFLRVNAVSRRLYDLFLKNGLKNIYYTPNGVDDQMFVFHKNKPHSPFVIGYSGSKAHDWRKGVTKFILPGARKAKANTKIAMLGTKGYVPLRSMPKFYKGIDCYVCASSSEGFSLSVLEAAASGCAVISTMTG